MLLGGGLRARVLKIIDLGSEGPGICGAKIFPVIVQEQSEAKKLGEKDWYRHVSIRNIANILSAIF